MLRTLPFVPMLSLALLLSWGCGDDDPSTPTNPTPPTTVTESFSGTITRNGGMTHAFNTTLAGSVTATLVSLTPDSATVVGLSLGTFNGTVCQIILANDRATQGTVVVGTVSTFGNLCVRLYDAAGTLPQPTSYEVQVVHP